MKQKTNQNKNIMYEFQKMVTNVFVIFMLGFFPLFYQNKYFNVREAKLLFFNVCVVGLIILTFVFVSTGWWEEKKAKGLGKKKVGTKEKNLKCILSEIPVTSWFAGIFFLAVIFSTVFSVYPKESFYGTDGRKLGAIVFLFCLFIYMVLGKYLQPGIWMAWIFLVSNLLVVMIAILQFWGLDFLHMFDNLSNRESFISTIGNINAAANYFCMILPIGMVLYYLSETFFSKMIYGFFLVLGFYGAYITTADSWILGVGASFLAMLWFSLKDNHHMKHFLELCIIFLVSSLMLKISLLAAQAGNINTVQSQEFRSLKMQNCMISGAVLLAEGFIFILGIWLIKILEKRKSVPPYQKIRRFLFTVLVILAGIGILIFILANLSEDKQWNGVFQWMNYLKLQDDFGTGRGIIWKRTIKEWLKLEPWRKVLGYGVNCFHQFYYQSLELAENSVRIIDPHNEFLLFLSIMGIFGAIGYFGLLISTMVSAGKMSREYPVMMMGTVMLSSYLAQGMVNNPTVFITPNLFLFLGILRSMERNYKET